MIEAHFEDNLILDTLPLTSILNMSKHKSTDTLMIYNKGLDSLENNAVHSLNYKELMVKIKYLVENSEREHEILQRFDEFLDNISDFLVTLNIHPRYSWYLIELPTEKLVPSVIGEVDILAGNFEPADPKQFEECLNRFRELDPDMHPVTIEHLAAIDLAWKNGLKWIPSLNYLVGIEVKSCYLPWSAPEISEDEIKSKKSSKGDLEGIRKQVDKLLNLGFDKVGLFEFIANPPADGVGSKPWNIAAHISGESFEAMSNIFSKRLSENSPVGHGVCSFSGILGREEHHSGSYTYPILRQAQNNPNLSEKDTQANRLELEQNLARILKNLPQPRNMPAVFVYDKKTQDINFINEGVIIC